MQLIEIIIIIVLGSAFGSFFNVCIYRLPAKKSIIFPASHCPGCSKAIPIWLNIPILGYIISRGKCKYCESKIHWHYPLVEFITPVLFLLLYSRFGLSIVFFQYLILFSFGIVIFFIDAFHQIIPDSLSLPLIPLGILFSLLPFSPVSFRNSLLSAIAGFLLFFLLSWSYVKLKGQMGLGGGDIKLIAGIGAFLGIAGLIFVILVSSLIGIITIILIRHDFKKHFSFGPFMIIASMLFVLYGIQIIDLYISLFI